MKEHLEPGPGYAIIGRWVFSDPDAPGRVLQADTYFLSPGEGILFLGKDDNPEGVVRFQQSELEGILRRTVRSLIQLIAIV